MKGIVPGGSSEELDCLGTVLALGLAPPEAGLAEDEDRAAVGTFALAVARTAEGAVDITIVVCLLAACLGAVRSGSVR